MEARSLCAPLFKGPFYHVPEYVTISAATARTQLTSSTKRTGLPKRPPLASTAVSTTCFPSLCIEISCEKPTAPALTSSCITHLVRRHTAFHLASEAWRPGGSAQCSNARRLQNDGLIGENISPCCCRPVGLHGERSPLLTIFWHCSFSYFSSRTGLEASFGNQTSMVSAEDSASLRVWQC